MVNYANARRSTKSLQIGGDNNKPVCTQVETKISIHSTKTKIRIKHGLSCSDTSIIFVQFLISLHFVSHLNGKVGKFGRKKSYLHIIQGIFYINYIF